MGRLHHRPILPAAQIVQCRSGVAHRQDHNAEPSECSYLEWHEVHHKQRQPKYDHRQSIIRTPQRSMKQSYLSYLIEILNSDEWLGVGDCIEIAKGKNKLPEGWNEYIKLQWRQLK